MKLNYRVLPICVSIFALCGMFCSESAFSADADLNQVRKQAIEFLNGLVRAFSEETRGQDFWKKQPDTYVELRKLGKMLDENMVSSLRSAEPGDVISEILLVADEVTRRPKALDELRQWYGRYKDQVPIDFLMSHLPPSRERDILIADKSPGPAGSLPKTGMGVAGRKAYRLRPQHAIPEYRLAWQAILLSLPSDEKRVILENTLKALAQIKDLRTLPIVVEYCRHVIGSKPEYWHLGMEQMEKALSLISKFETQEAVDAFLECLKLAEARGRAGPKEDRGSVWSLIIKHLVGDENYQHRKYEVLVKARLSAYQREPKAHPLTDSQRRLLEESLRIAAKAGKMKN